MDLTARPLSTSSSLLRRTTKPSPVLGIIVFILFVAAISGAGYWMMRGGEISAKSINILPKREVAIKKPGRKQYFAPFDTTVSSRPRQRAGSSSRELQPAVANTPAPAEIVSPREPGHRTESASRPTERVEPTALRGNVPAASDSNDIGNGIEGPIYSAIDGDVTPPRLVDMQSVSPAPVESEPSEPIVVDIVVNEMGTLDSVKSTVIPRTLGRYIWMTNSLSVVKTWHFRPALKNGQPVKYRLLFRLEGS